MIETVIQIKSERAINAIVAVITCDEIVEYTKTISTKTVPTKKVPTKSDPANFNERKLTC